MTPGDERLQEGIAAYKEGRKQEASRLIKQALQLDPQNERAWLWMSGLVNSDEHRRTCLERVLAINPDNKAARLGLQKLSAGSSPDIRPSSPTKQPPPPEKVKPAQPPPPAITPIPRSVAVAKAQEPEPSSLTALRQQTTLEKRPGRGRRLLAAGLILLVIVLPVLAVALFSDIALSQIADLAWGQRQEIPPEEESAIISAVYENIAAANSENIDRYMASIHSNSAEYQLTREIIEKAYRDYDLTATIKGVEIIRYSADEAWVSYVLETRKRTGPDFRDNRMYGIYILRPENGQWKLFDQVVRKIEYFE